MCGRLAIYSSPETFATYLDAQTELQLAPSYNVAPSQPIPACRLDERGQRTLIALHWGLVPHWSNGPDNRYTMINARAETIQAKPAYRGPFRTRRCLIPADGFYEWQRANGKQPYYFHRPDGAPLVLAGLWDRWSGDAGEVIDSCTIIVTEANELMHPIHDRMPVILPRETWATWLDNDSEPDALQSLLTPYDKTDVACHAVSRQVNQTRNDSPQLIRPEQSQQGTADLFGD